VTFAVVGGIALIVCAGCYFLFCRHHDDDDEESQRKLVAPGLSSTLFGGSSSSSRRRRPGDEDGDSTYQDKTVAPPRAQRPPDQSANWSSLLTTGKAIVTGLLVAGTALPGLEGICNLAVFVLYEVEQLHNKADDVVAAGERVVKILEVLKILADNSTKLADDEAKRYVESRMDELYSLLEQFSQIVQSFRDKGWLRRRWFLYEHGAKLSALDDNIVQTLDNLRLAYDLARDRNLARLLETQKYEMEQAIEKQISRLVHAGQTEHDAVLILADNESATRAVAAAAHVADAELGPELALAVASMQSGIDDIKADVQGLREIVARKSAQQAADVEKTELLEKFEIELDEVDQVPFARGGWAQVHKATYSGEHVALKRIPLQGYTAAKRAKLIAGFAEELSIMVQLRNPLVVSFYGVVTRDDPEYLGMCMELCVGGSLRHRLDDDDAAPVIEWKLRRQWLSQIARGMQYLYSNGIQHRDLKASNILLSDNNTAKVADFGLSRSEGLRTQTTGVSGTPAFMSPELLSENLFTEKSDVFSYGMTIFEVLTRAHPWDDCSQAQIVMKVALKDERPSMPEDHDAPEDLVDLMETCWALNPDDRPWFADVVQRLLIAPSPDAAPETASESPEPPTIGSTSSTVNLLAGIVGLAATEKGQSPHV